MTPNDTQAVGADDPQVDTSVAQPSEASEVVTDTPEATQGTVETQEVATPDTKVEDTVEEKLLAGKYKTEEELEKAYKELESKFGQTASEKAELARILDNAFATPESTDTDGYGEGTLDNETDQLKRDNAVIKFIISHDDANAESMKEILASDPLVNQITGHEARLEYAYQKSKNMGSAKTIEEATKKASEQATAKVVEKQAAQVESAQATAPVNEDEELKTRMYTGTLEEREIARREYIKKHLI